MDKIRLKMQNFMNGRNGYDEIGKDISGFSIILYIISLFLKSQILYGISMIGILYSIFRIFSKNLYTRRSENQQYIKRKYRFRSRLEMKKEYRIFKCKDCERRIRVPRGKGKVEITCPVCGRKIIRRT